MMQISLSFSFSFLLLSIDSCRDGSSSIKDCMHFVAYVDAREVQKYSLGHNLNCIRCQNGKLL